MFIGDPDPSVTVPFTVTALGRTMFCVMADPNPSASTPPFANPDAPGASYVTLKLGLEPLLLLLQAARAKPAIRRLAVDSDLMVNFLDLLETSQEVRVELAVGPSKSPP